VDWSSGVQRPNASVQQTPLCDKSKLFYVGMIGVETGGDDERSLCLTSQSVATQHVDDVDQVGHEVVVTYGGNGSKSGARCSRKDRRVRLVDRRGQ